MPDTIMGNKKSKFKKNLRCNFVGQIIGIGNHRITEKDTKKDHRKVLLKSFHLNGHTIGFYPKAKIK